MSKAIKAGLQSWFDDTAAVWPHQVPHQADHYACLIHDAFYHQDNIGWSNMLRGRISVTWMQAYDLRSESRSLDRQQFRSHILGPSLVEHLWTLGITIWKARNEDMYGPDGLLTQRNLDELTHRITAAYNDRAEIPPSLRTSLFTIPLDTLQARSMTVRQQWLAHHDRLRSFSEAVMAPDEPLPRNRALHSFFNQFPIENRIDLPPD